MTKRTKLILLSGFVLIIYGYLSRWLNIYFFWDSKAIGFIFLIIAILSYLFDLHKTRKLIGKKNGWVRLGLYFFGFGLIFLPIIISKLKSSDAYVAATDFLKTNPEIRNEIGMIKGFGLIPTGSSTEKQINGIESGNAIFKITLKGEKKYKDILIELIKEPNSTWTTVDIQ